ncbi:hypothetical protein [Comamonas sp. JC664]|uniref:hypothetical protein n=1 Tax=Comamonas sp. JC664 TaxID=2801917 RepID=UPI0017482CA5|nr:hypothetical protein [Comamonas sp. JC664]MBL0695051.1 hypothetical protein [Comamonas sp. JC664]GHH04450.1 hypothetical protein GCM10012319_73850 [Comamonas sp. KCTC 72670]
MLRSIFVLTLTLGGFLAGCGGMPEEGDATGLEELRSRDDATPDGEVFQSVVTFSHTGVTVSYNPDNDLFTVRDTANDGRHAFVDIINHNTGSNLKCWNRQGVNTVESCFRNYPNNPLLSVRACTSPNDNPVNFSCGAWRNIQSLAPAPEPK